MKCVASKEKNTALFLIVFKFFRCSLNDIIYTFIYVDNFNYTEPDP